MWWSYEEEAQSNCDIFHPCDAKKIDRTYNKTVSKRYRILTKQVGRSFSRRIQNSSFINFWDRRLTKSQQKWIFSRFLPSTFQPTEQKRKSLNIENVLRCNTEYMRLWRNISELFFWWVLTNTLWLPIAYEHAICGVQKGFHHPWKESSLPQIKQLPIDSLMENRWW